MSLIIATGSNLGDKANNLALALNELSTHFDLIQASRIYSSPAIEYLQQPDFYNQVLEFKPPSITPNDALEIMLAIELKLGRKRDISKGPRTIDIDIIFWDLKKHNTKNLVIPHPSWAQRSFVVMPLSELPYFETLKNHYKIPTQFENTAVPL